MEQYSSYSECDVLNEHEKYLREEEKLSEEEISERMKCESYIITELNNQRDFFTENLTELMKEINPDSDQWECEGEDLGWRHRSGSIPKFTAKNGLELLQKISPNTDCHYTVYKGDGEIFINIKHHDNPCSGDKITVIPYEEKICNECSRDLRENPVEQNEIPMYYDSEDKTYLCPSCTRDYIEDNIGENSGMIQLGYPEEVIKKIEREYLEENDRED